MNEIISQKPMNVTKTAEFLGFSKNYIYKLVYLGKIPYYKPEGGKIFFKQEELEDFIFRNRVSADYELKEKGEQLIANKKGCAL